MDLLAVASGVGRQAVAPAGGRGRGAVPDQPVPGHHRGGQLRRRSSCSSGRSRSSRVAKMLADRRGPDRAGPQGRRAGPAGPRVARSRSALAALAEARREANDILARAQRVAQETRDADIAATREELERMRERATGRDRRREAAGDRRAPRRGRRPRAAGRRPRRRRIDERRAPAAARRGVPRRRPTRTAAGNDLMAKPRHAPRAATPRPPSRSRSATTRSTPGGRSSTLAAEHRSATTELLRVLAQPGDPARAARRGRRRAARRARVDPGR